MSKGTCKFNLNVATRLMLLMNLPEQGSVIEMISKRNIRKKLTFLVKNLKILISKMKMVGLHDLRKLLQLK